MADDFGNGVSRTLSALQRQFQQVVWQASKPPLDSELNLVGQIELEQMADVVRSQMHSGFLLDPLESDSDFLFHKNWCNWFKLGNQGAGQTDPVLWANVNGWLVPVTGTSVVDGDTSNRINLWTPPTSDTRADFVFLEVWKAQVAPNPSVSNKPNASTIYKYGNTEFGGTNIVDDMEDPAIGFETTERVQLQYRLRVVGKGDGLGDSVDFATFPDGLDDPNVLAQGAATAPVAGITYTNMRDTLGDPGLWRAGDGQATNSLNTVDGYTYAIPICAVFRRNTTAFSSRVTSGNPNQNGAFNRNPTAASITNRSEATRTLTSVTLTSALPASGVGSVGVVNVTGLSASGLDNSLIDWSTAFIMIDDEIIGLDSVNGSAGTITISDPASPTVPRQGRGRNGTQAVYHAAGSTLSLYCFRPDNKFADSIAASDVLDLRRGVTAGEWDYEAVLAHNLGKLFRGDLQTCYKQSAVSGGDVEGVVIPEVATLWANGTFPVPNQTAALDGPDGIRTTWSDSAVVQNNVSMILHPDTGSAGSPVEVTDYTVGANAWGPAAGFSPSGWQEDGAGWVDQTIIRFDIGGSDTNSGARRTVRTSADNRIVRFVTPKEYWISREPLLRYDPDFGTTNQNFGQQAPFLLRFQGETSLSPAAGTELPPAHGGPIYPLPEHNFEMPYIVLGGVVNSTLRSTSATTVAAGSTPSGLDQVRFPGVDFDTGWAPTAIDTTSTDGITNLLLHGSRNLWDMLTRGGKDLSGRTSELYVVLSGDNANSNNCGVFKVLGAGTTNYTMETAATPDALVVQRVGYIDGGPTGLTGAATVTAEVRSQYTHTLDGNTAGAGSSACIVLTDLSGQSSPTIPPWQLSQPVGGDAILDTSVLYGPSRGGLARVADSIDEVGLVQTSANLVRNSPTTVDTTFSAEAGVPDGEYYFPTQFVQTWNHLPSLGLSAPYAPEYGDSRYMVDQRRESEVFVDNGSKTLVVRPFQQTTTSMDMRVVSSGALVDSAFTGVLNWNAGNIWESTLTYGVEFPPEFMPRFGRQDIPFHRPPAGTAPTTGPVYYGINHLFGDSQNNGDSVFRIIGGIDNSTAAPADPVSLFMVTGTTNTLDYGEYGTGTGLGTGGYKARYYQDVNVISSDMPRGLEGIQLPPYIGIARVYGVYDAREFAGNGVWDGDRVTPSTLAGLPTNLLKTDADKQTIFIVKGGAEDVGLTEDDHTYVLPSNAIDVSLSGSWAEGETFESLATSTGLVVECIVFGFARGFINKNNMVLVRNHDAAGAAAIGATVPGTPSVVDNVSNIIPLPLPWNDQFYATYSRTVYQGDPFMTRDGSTRNAADYATRYGQIPASGSEQLATPMQQYDATNDYAQVPLIPNARSLEILATADFWTTLGTGKMGGDIYPGTVADPAFITTAGAAPTRIAPAGSSDPLSSNYNPIFQSDVRALSAGQGSQSIAGSLTINVLEDAATSINDILRFSKGGIGGGAPASGAWFELTSGTDFTGGSASATAQSLAIAINGHDEATSLEVQAIWNGATQVILKSTSSGAASNHAMVTILPGSGAAYSTGFSFLHPGAEGAVSGAFYATETTSHLLGGKDSPVNAVLNIRGTSPVQLAGLSERLPLGILVQDSDFLGEDPLKTGTSGLVVDLQGGTQSTSEATPLAFSDDWKTREYGRIQGSGQLGMADGKILNYVPGTAAAAGSALFRLFRGGGSTYVLEPSPEGGPVDYAAGMGFAESEKPVLKGAVLAGRAFLVRNYPEVAFSNNSRRSYGDEVQMVIVTQAVYGQGAYADCEYTLDGQISPTGYGEGLAAADRYRIEGKLLVPGHSEAGENPDIELAPYPGRDPAIPDDCP